MKGDEGWWRVVLSYYACNYLCIRSLRLRYEGWRDFHVSRFKFSIIWSSNLLLKEDYLEPCRKWYKKKYAIVQNNNNMGKQMVNRRMIAHSNNKAYNLNPCGFGCTPSRYLFFVWLFRHYKFFISALLFLLRSVRYLRRTCCAHILQAKMAFRSATYRWDHTSVC